MIEDCKRLLSARWINGLLEEMKRQDPGSGDHAYFVGLYSMRLAQMMRADLQFQASVFIAGLLHDCGKLGIPLMIIEKPGKLTYEEFEMIKKHPSYGCEILEGLSMTSEYGIDEMILQHHERVDGLGYPSGKKGDEIVLGAKIIGVVDAYSAMVTQHAYKGAMTHAEALAELFAWRGKQFDSRIVDLFATWNEADLSEHISDDDRQNVLLWDALTRLPFQRNGNPGNTNYYQEFQSLMIWNSLLDSAQSSVEAQDILRAVQAQVERLIRFDRLGVLLARQDDMFCTVHEIVTKEGLTAAPKGMLLPVPQSGLEFVAEHRRPHIERDIANSPEFAEDHYLASIGVHSVLRIPLLKGDSVYGIMTFKSLEKDAFSEQDRQVAEQIARVLSTNIYNAKLLYDLRNQAERDGMTGLYNRRFLNDLLARPVSPFRDSVSGEPIDDIGLLIVDVCDFKSYNDTYGHVAGDERLCQIAAMLENVSSEMAYAIRYGGDEFVVVFADLNKNIEYEIEQQVDQYNRNLKKGITPLRLSLGTCCGSWQEMNALIAKADANMYRRKPSAAEAYSG